MKKEQTILAKQKVNSLLNSIMQVEDEELQNKLLTDLVDLLKIIGNKKLIPPVEERVANKKSPLFQGARGFHPAKSSKIPYLKINYSKPTPNPFLFHPAKEFPLFQGAWGFNPAHPNHFLAKAISASKRVIFSANWLVASLHR